MTQVCSSCESLGGCAALGCGTQAVKNGLLAYLALGQVEMCPACKCTVPWGDFTASSRCPYAAACAISTCEEVPVRLRQKVSTDLEATVSHAQVCAGCV